MRKFGVGLACALILGLSTILLQQIRTKRLFTETAAFREQAAQLSALRDENQRLTEELRTMSQNTRSDIGELVRLRAQSTRLRQLEEEMAKLKAERERVALTNAAATSVADNPFDSNHGVGASIKVSHAKHWGFAMLNFAANNQGRFPTSLAEAAPFLHDELSPEEKAEALKAAERYELVFHGTRQELVSLPPESTIIVREKEPWLDPQGRLCKAYCMSDGGAYIRPSRKNDFEEWEILRIPKAKQQ